MTSSNPTAIDETNDALSQIQKRQGIVPFTIKLQDLILFTHKKS